METKIIEVSNEHFEWELDENGEFIKKILSDEIITKQVKVTYNDDGNEVSREAHVELDISNIDITTISNQKLIELKERLNSL